VQRNKAVEAAKARRPAPPVTKPTAAKSIAAKSTVKKRIDQEFGF
jgi:hypothetical protein